MAELQVINGHTVGMGKARDYFLGKEGERALAQDSLNLAPEEDGLTWAEQMEITRREAGNDQPWNGKAPITYKHYVISPDPRDNCDLDKLRELTMTWVRENFANYQVAVTYHDDNENQVIHAHVIVNNTNLVTGGRISSELTKARVKGLNNSLQNLCLELGLSAFSEDHSSLNESEMQAAGKNVSRDGDERSRTRWRDHGRKGRGWASAAPQRRAGARRRARGDVRERGVREREGTSWKQEVRERVDVARRVARSERELVAVLKVMGVTVTESARGDLLFSHPDGGGRRVSGSRLGPAYSRFALRVGYSSGYVDYVRSPRGTNAPALSKEQIKAVARSVSVIGRVEAGADVRAADVAALLDYNAKHSISGYEGYGHDRKAQRMLSLARQIHLFDQSGPRAEKARRSEVEVVAEWVREKRGPSRPGRARDHEEVVGYEEPASPTSSNEPQAVRWKER